MYTNVGRNLKKSEEENLQGKDNKKTKNKKK